MHDTPDGSDSSVRKSTDNSAGNNMSREVGYGASGDDMRSMQGKSTANDLPNLTIDGDNSSSSRDSRPPYQGSANAAEHRAELERQAKDTPPKPTPADGHHSSIGEALNQAIKEHPEMVKQLAKSAENTNPTQPGVGSASKDDSSSRRGHSRDAI